MLTILFKLILSASLLINSCVAQESVIAQSIQDKYCNEIIADYIVVGVGTAGALMANELSGDLQTSVIALHSGENLSNDPLIKFSRNAAITVPAGVFETSLYENGDTVSQVNLNDRELVWAIGLPEGGASSVNAGAWSRESTFVDSQWESIAGPNWSPAVILDLYKKLENYTGNTPNPGARGFDGPLSIRQFPIITQVSAQVTQAISNGAGVPILVDYNDPLTPIGASYQMQYTQTGIAGALRESSAVAFLNPSVVTPDGHGVNGRKLEIIFNATALRTTWSGNTATGVEYLKDGVVKTAKANKGVVVCAGLRSSPFLMYSGVGPASLLQSLGIPVIFDNPNVGQGLVDQPSLYLFFSTDPSDTQVPPVDPNGLFTQISYLPDPTGNPNVRALRFASINPIPGLLLGLFDLVQPKSRGSITINSADPLQPPVVNPQYLSNSDDLDLFIRGVQITIANINAAFTNPLYSLIIPDPTILPDTAAVTEYIRNNVNQDLHYQCHCSIGSVVDNRGKVIGVNGLYVADDSIIPEAVSMDGSPMATAYLAAANVARLLLQ